jgi:hypothetical protein
VNKPPPVLPPSFSMATGQSDSELEEERILRQLEQIVRSLTPRIGVGFDAADAARYLYDSSVSARAAAVEKRKTGSASLASVAKQLRDIASGSSTLLRRLKSADKNVFDAWANVAEEGSYMTRTQEWLWLESEINDWIESRVRQRDAEVV